MNENSTNENFLRDVASENLFLEADKFQEMQELWEEFYNDPDPE